MDKLLSVILNKKMWDYDMMSMAYIANYKILILLIWTSTIKSTVIGDLCDNKLLVPHFPH